MSDETHEDVLMDFAMEVAEPGIDVRKLLATWSERYPRHRETMRALAFETIAGHPSRADDPLCEVCGQSATCIGKYERADAPWAYACDACCGHGNEDGECAQLYERD